jgi:hypothetical protein
MAEKKMDEAELSAILDGLITDSRSFDRSDLALNREWAIRFYDGECDIPTQEGRSQVVSHDVADALEWILPALLRIFTASELVAIFEPVGPGDEEGAKQATACINHLFLHDCDGYRVIKDAMHDGLLHGNGPVKTWWEGSPEYKIETVRGLQEIEYKALLSEPDLDEVIWVKKYPEGHPEEAEEEKAEPIGPLEEQESGRRPAGLEGGNGSGSSY